MDLCWFYSLMDLQPLKQHLKFIEQIKATAISSKAFLGTPSDFRRPLFFLWTTRRAQASALSPHLLSTDLSPMVLNTVNMFNFISNCQCSTVQCSSPALNSPGLLTANGSYLLGCLIPASHLSRTKQTDEFPFPLLACSYSPIRHTQRLNLSLFIFPSLEMVPPSTPLLKPKT